MSADEQILNYLRQHPGARDTMEGIMTWWLSDAEPRPTTSEMRAGLERLVAQGLIIAESGPDGRLCYRSAGPSPPP